MKKIIVILISSLFLLAGCCENHKDKQKRSSRVNAVNHDVKRYDTRSGTDIYETCIRGYVVIYNYEHHFVQLRDQENKPIRCMVE